MRVPKESQEAALKRWSRIRRLTLERAEPPRRRWPWLLLVAFALGYVAGSVLHASEAIPPAVSLQVRPLVMLQRGDIRVEVRVPRHGENRLLSIAWSSDIGTAGSTLRPLEGEDAQVLHTLALPSQPAANYLFVAAVFNDAGKLRGRAEAKVVVPEDGDR
jgi:hypothetical protein